MTQTAATLIAQRLADAGCRHAFGMPGGEVLVLLDALRDAKVTFTLCKHENAAGFMAEGSWHATGAPGVLLATIGPGLANAVNSVANAYQEQVPLIVLSGCVDGAEAENYTHQVIDQTALLSPITKAQFRVAPGSADLVIQKALSIALADPPGPVHIDLPVGLAAAESPATPISPRAERPGGWPDRANLETAAKRLASASRPLILAGLGAALHGAGDQISALSQARGIPVLTTYKAKGVMDESGPLALGGHGLSPLSDSHVLPLLRASDCVVLAGYDPIEMRTGWIQPWQSDCAIELLHADTQHGMHGAALRVIGDVGRLVQDLHDALPAGGEVWPDGAPGMVRAALDTAFKGPDRWGPHAVFRTLQETLPDNAIVTVDSGAHRILFSQMWRAPLPGTVLQSACFCTMGVSVPLATGYAIAAPARRVVAVVGDAGFDMVAGDLATLRQSGLPVAIVVLADDSLALIEKKQTAMQLPTHGVGFAGTSIPAVAQAYGGHGVEVSDAETLGTELAAAGGRDRFTVISCRIDKHDYDGAF